MAQVIIEDLDPGVLEKLEARAKENGRALQAELKHILETAASAPRRIPDKWEVIKKKAELMRKQIADRTKSAISEPSLTEKQLDAAAVIEAFRSLRKKISPCAMTIGEMREEGRRF
ncbi:hypothetical protein [Microseira sp. BLCC-F43]|jgi:plasmid stability protein|uniref:FitA-like ribbon-helix-helix domain-containing protein n=1 Tax=Microseira sp. BLCC-F43 TaxID=3153602 RepID=UPI0035B7F42C